MLKKAKKYWGQKFFFEYLRYLHNVKYDCFNNRNLKILRRKWFLANFRNLCNFSNFDQNFYILFFETELLQSKTVPPLLTEWRFPFKKVKRRRESLWRSLGKHSFPKTSRRCATIDVVTNCFVRSLIAVFGIWTHKLRKQLCHKAHSKSRIWKETTKRRKVQESLPQIS